VPTRCQSPGRRLRCHRSAAQVQRFSGRSAWSGRSAGMLKRETATWMSQIVDGAIRSATPAPTETKPSKLRQHQQHPPPPPGASYAPASRLPPPRLAALACLARSCPARFSPTPLALSAASFSPGLIFLFLYLRAQAGVLWQIWPGVGTLPRRMPYGNGATAASAAGNGDGHLGRLHSASSGPGTPHARPCAATQHKPWLFHATLLPRPPPPLASWRKGKHSSGPSELAARCIPPLPHPCHSAQHHPHAPHRHHQRT
jgi:hypothetical protein